MSSSEELSEEQPFLGPLSKFEWHGQIYQLDTYIVGADKISDQDASLHYK